MRPRLSISMFLLAGLSTGSVAFAAGNAPCGVTTSLSADGVVELSNVDNNEQCDVTPSAPAQPGNQGGAASPEASSPAPGGTLQASQAADAPSAPGDQAKDPRQNYRDSVLQGVPGTKAAYPSVSRRYKMVDKAAYRAINAVATPQADPSTPAARDAPGQ